MVIINIRNDIWLYIITVKVQMITSSNTHTLDDTGCLGYQSPHYRNITIKFAKNPVKP